jgi:phage gp29-like protein
MAGTSLGYVDDGATGFTLLDSLLEYVPDLTWPDSVRTYARMRWDPTLQSNLKAYTLPIRRASWALDPAGCRDEVVTKTADQLGLPILGQDPEPSPARRRGVVWADHLRLALLDLTFGHMVFERTYGDVNGASVQPINVLQERMPQTIRDIRINPDGSLAEVRQNPMILNSAAPSIGVAPIPAQNLVWYAHDKEGTAWMGQSLLRPAYGPWLIKHEMSRVLATSNRRFGMGVPSVEAPPGSTPTQVAQAAAMASAARVGDQSGVGMPSGFKFALTGLSGSAPDTLAFMRYLDTQMSRSTLTGLLDLGDTANGSRALGDSFLDVFILALQSIADEHAGTATSQIVVPFVDVNWGEDEPAPQVVCGDVGSEHAVTAQALAELVKSGALQPDPTLDAFIRGEWKLPPRAEAAPWQEPAAPVVPNVAKPAKPSARAVSAAVGGQPFRRQPTEVEAAAKTDFGAVQQGWESALDGLIADWAKITKAQRKQILDQISAAVHENNLDALSALAVDSQAAAELLAATMSELADEAAAQQAGEADAQGVSVDVGVPDHGRLAATAVVVAAALASSLADGSARKALQAWTPTASPNDVTSAVGLWMDSLTDASLRDQLGGGLSLAQGAGRGATLMAASDAGLNATYYASEILDANTCDPCQAEDGQAFGSLDEADATYGSGGFVDCEGGLRCRGIVVAVWDESAKAA